jgi:hypothetical protein
VHSMIEPPMLNISLKDISIPSIDGSWLSSYRSGSQTKKEKASNKWQSVAKCKGRETVNCNALVWLCVRQWININMFIIISHVVTSALLIQMEERKF